MYIDYKLYNEIKKVFPIVCVDLLILNEGKVLLLKRNNAPAYGQWWFPGGRIFKNESIFDAAQRKGIEELGISLQPQNIISVEESIFNLQNDEVDIHTINIIVQMDLINSDINIKLDKNHSEFKWFEVIDINLHPSVKNPLVKINFKFVDK